MTDAAATAAPIDVLEQLMAARYSCRGFKPDPVPREVIERILGAAQKTASWCNSQPWQVVITSGEATARFREVIYPAAAGGAPMSGDFEFPREYRGVYLDRRRESGFQLYNAVGIARGDKAAAAQQALQNFSFFGAPHVAIITTDEALGVYGAVDCGGYVTSFMLAAQALGVATVPQAALAFHAGVVRKHFGLGDDRRVVCGISFGYADPDHKANSYRTNRAALGEVATFVDK
ncbi:MAG: nitroreductase [Pseudomonadota bacterium]